MGRQILILLVIAGVLVAGAYGYQAFQRNVVGVATPSPSLVLPAASVPSSDQAAVATPEPGAAVTDGAAAPTTPSAYQDPCQMALQTLDTGLANDPQMVFRDLVGRIMHVGMFPPQDDILRQVFTGECAGREAQMIREYLRTVEHVKTLQDAVVERVGTWQIDFTSRLILKAAANEQTGIGQRFLELRLREGGASLAKAWRDFAVAVNAELEKKEQAFITGSALTGSTIPGTAIPGTAPATP